MPWHRVVNSSGLISSRGPGTNGAALQRQALQREGVEVVEDVTNRMKVDIRQDGWFPAIGTVDIGVELGPAAETYTKQRRTYLRSQKPEAEAEGVKLW